MNSSHIKEFALRVAEVGLGYIVALESRSTLNRVVCYHTNDFYFLSNPRYFEDEIAANEYIDKLISKKA